MSAQPTSRRGWAIALLIALLALVMLPNVVWLLVGRELTHPLIAPIILPLALLLALFALLGRRIWIACLVLLPFAVLAPTEAFYIATYGRPTFAEIIATLIATNPREMREYVGPLLVPLIACVLLAIALPTLAAWSSYRARLRLPWKAMAWMGAIAVATPLAVGVATGVSTKGAFGARWQASVKQEADLGGQIQFGWPFGLIPRLIDYRREWNDMRANVDRLGQYRFHAYRTRPQQQRQVYVLVIGEASRRDHWELFGYDRPTNPELSKTANLVRVTDLDSAWPESITAIPMILTRKPATITSFTWWKEASILRAMQEAGYETYWISNQQAIGKYDSPVSTFAFEAQHQMFLNHASWSVPGAYDDVLLQALRDVLHDSNKDLFIVLHLMGNHQSYDYRYPDAFKRWRPTESDPWEDESSDDSSDDASADASTSTDSTADSGDDSSDDSSDAPDPESIQRTTNSYDNSILYTDHILASIIGILRDNGAMSALWFESDHGESLLSDTCQMEGHGHGTIYEYALPVLFWFSDSYDHAFPEKVAALRANANKRTMSENTFESLADMAGVGFPGHDPSWSLFSAHWRYHPRIVNRPAQGNIDTASIGKECGTVHQATPPPAPTQASPTHEQAMDGPASPASTATRRPPG
ncbi:MAG: sulfatase-like hydrolase/transferase [Proteobacteria bacterium]|nr:sulfatase-like hydrolase/transferase [Pseudomonadota bacterium]